MGKLAVDLTEAQTDRLLEEAKRLGVQPEDLARAAVVDLIAGGANEFARVVDEVLQKNAELYERLG